MCAGEIGVVCRWFAMPAVIDELISMTSSKRREAIWPNGLYLNNLKKASLFRCLGGLLVSK